MNNFFVLVDHKQKQLLAPASELPEDWMNINGLNLWGDEKIRDLSWAGHEGKGWVRITDTSIHSYTHASDWLDFTKLSISKIVSNQRKEKESAILNFKENNLIVDEKTKVALVAKKLAAKENPKSTFVWKFENSIVELTSAEIILIADFVEKYTQSCFDVEYKFQNSLESIKKISDLTKIDFNLDWPSSTVK